MREGAKPSGVTKASERRAIKQSTDATPIDAPTAQSLNTDGSEFPEREYWRGKAIDARLQAFNNLYIYHREVEAIVKHIGEELAIAKTRREVSGLLVLGESGSGKSALVKHLARSFPPSETTETTTLPVVSFTIPLSPSPTNLGAEVLMALGDPCATLGTADMKFRRLAILLAKAQTRIVCIDNFHDLPARRGSRGLLAASNWMRDFCGLPLPIVVVALGTQEAAIVRDMNDQLRRRMQARMKLPLLSATTLRTVLKEIDKKLPLAESSNLTSSDLAIRIHRATNGIFDYLMKLLSRCIVLATASGQERISIEILQAAFSAVHQDASATGNPFKPEYKGDELCKAGQVFFLNDKV